MSNVQLTGREVSVVWLDAETDRILGFTPENAPVVAPPGKKLKSYTLLHAAEIDRWMNRYRDQNNRDSEVETVRKLEAERPLRNAIKEAILERGKHVNQWNRDMNMLSIQAMDTIYERILERRRKAEVALAAEMFDASKKGEDLAIASPYKPEVKHG